MEIWKAIPGFEEYYEASTMGRIRSVDRKIWTKKHPNVLTKRKSKIIRASTLANGYKQVSICKQNKHYQYKVHKLVAMTFIPNPNNLPYVDHINAVRYDNRPENLRWCTVQQNTKWRDEKFSPGDRARKKVLCKENRKVFKTTYQAAEWVMSNRLTDSTNWKTISGNIRNACLSKKTAYKFHWAYIEGSTTSSNERKDKKS